MAKKKLIRVSRYYKLGLSQPALDFIDVNLEGDIPYFIDPRALRLIPSSWGQECVSLLQDFFRTVLKAIKKGDDYEAKLLLRGLSEPNETHLGLSKGAPRGRGLGNVLAESVWDSLTKSAAVHSGLLVDLEDTALLVDGIDRDRVSDIATNIIRGPLIRYTQEACSRYGIPLEDGVRSGGMWDPGQHEWFQDFVKLPMAGKYGRLLLVPKIAIRTKLSLDQDEYFRDYILTFLAQEEISAGSALVRVLKDGTQWVAKKDLVKKYGKSKKLATKITEQNPKLLDDYRKKRARSPRAPLGHSALHKRTGMPKPSWDTLLNDVVTVKAGSAGATTYHAAIEKLLTALFYPALTHPRSEVQIHAGRKRIDITFENTATHGFFWWVGQHHPAPHLFIECKNYKGDPGNPELDQLSGRFSPSRGKVGILACRNFADKELFISRCRDTSNDQRGFVIPLDDADLRDLVFIQKDQPDSMEFRILMERFERLVM